VVGKAMTFEEFDAIDVPTAETTIFVRRGGAGSAGMGR
jgi:hypothetical protein